VVANIKYSQVLLQIEPLERELNKLQKQLDESTKRANDCIVQLEELDEQTKILNKELMKKTSEAEALKMDLKKAEDTLVSA
jgi:chromosome segregation ATPase